MLPAIIGGSLISGFLGDRSSRRAAGASNAATQASIAEQQRQFNALMERSQPYNQAGVSALNSLLSMEGLPLVSAGGGNTNKPLPVVHGGIPPRELTPESQGMPGSFSQRGPNGSAYQVRNPGAPSGILNYLSQYQNNRPRPMDNGEFGR